MSNLRFANIMASVVEVSCPYCGEPLPSPDNGSDQWLPSQVEAGQSERVCNACDEPFRVVYQDKAFVAKDRA